MILVSGILGDGMVELMCSRLQYMGYEYLLLDEAQFPGQIDVTWESARRPRPGIHFVYLARRRPR